ncbi:MAG TPA: antibiotic biosynthesis monooxygenase [Kofleriaceae bacterium]|jgi:quinol monooxygenase YgiN
MLIIAGTLTVAPSDRDAYLDAVKHVSVLARAARGCHAFMQSADPIEPGVINIYERWSSDETLREFRTSGGPKLETPPVISASVARYIIAGVEKA